ncbi:glutamate racemase [Acidovorax sp. Leaf160]|uniref:glutamate racemase n=1 Tax=Acidovorax sp. Leaf160 TaxID=1736280 RepID=UPI0006FA11E4|nr:glutamate racemase [Acidovorax sp. Leaf160]KQR45945.1 glutamate racemase [Acidovorax sp. Leaf160]
MTSATQRPIGVFDSGIGGLSVLRALRAELPNERFVYLADSGHAPYGERGDAYVAARTHAIAGYLQAAHDIKALVVACNTATAAAIHEVRSRYPALPLVGLEPAIKPSVALTRTGHIGVIGTRGTLGSSKFGRLMTSLQGQAHFVVQPCDGLAYAIERTTDHGPAAVQAATETEALCARYIGAMGAFGAQAGQIDTLVLGCTHYIFAEHVLRSLVGPHVQLVETGVPVAVQTRRLLDSAGLLAEVGREDAAAAGETAIRLLSTGDLGPLRAAAHRWLNLPASDCAAVAVPSAIDLSAQNTAVAP